MSGTTSPWVFIVVERFGLEVTSFCHKGFFHGVFWNKANYDNYLEDTQYWIIGVSPIYLQLKGQDRVECVNHKFRCIQLMIIASIDIFQEIWFNMWPAGVDLSRTVGLGEASIRYFNSTEYDL